MTQDWTKNKICKAVSKTHSIGVWPWFAMWWMNLWNSSCLELWVHNQLKSSHSLLRVLHNHRCCIDNAVNNTCIHGWAYWSLPFIMYMPDAYTECYFNMLTNILSPSCLHFSCQHVLCPLQSIPLGFVLRLVCKGGTQWQTASVSVTALLSSSPFATAMGDHMVLCVYRNLEKCIAVVSFSW